MKKLASKCFSVLAHVQRGKLTSVKGPPPIKTSFSRFWARYWGKGCQLIIISFVVEEEYVRVLAKEGIAMDNLKNSVR